MVPTTCLFSEVTIKVLQKLHHTIFNARIWIFLSLSREIETVERHLSTTHGMPSAQAYFLNISYEKLGLKKGTWTFQPSKRHSNSPRPQSGAFKTSCVEVVTVK